MKIYCFLSIFFLTGISFTQSKKEQIEQLTNRVDSFNQVLSSERVDNSKKISTMESSKKYLEERYNELENNYNLLVNKVSTLSFDLQTSQADIVIKQQEISDLQTKLRFTNDSIFILQDKIEHLKLSLEDNNKTHTISSQVTDINGKNYRTVIIGSQTWMSENLDVDKFRNGDPIPEAKTDEEWEQAGKNKMPAWCYYDNDPKNGLKYGKLYNWYAVNDLRGLAPKGWHIPSDAEWQILENYLGEESAGNKIKSTSGWDNNGNGTNSSGFKGLPGGFRHSHGDFYRLGIEGCWYSSSLGYKGNPDSLYIWNNEDFFARDSQFGDLGNSVRCLKD
jgi:uncharacterized protein (TIGR02145 family)